MFKMIANGINVLMYVGICDFEYKTKQPVTVNIVLHGNPKFFPTNINDCMDYSKVCAFVQSWENREHVDLVETLLNELMDFVFKDSRVLIADIEILKPKVIPGTNHVGVGAYITRQEYEADTFKL